MITSWSPSRLDKYESCPQLAKFEIIQKLCPLCFKGKTRGGFDGVPVTCDTCGQTIVKGAALERGTLIDAAIQGYLRSETSGMPEEIRHPEILKLAAALRNEYKKSRVKVQFDIVLDRHWKPCSPFDKSAWLRAKLDALRTGKNTWEVIDWKTGGIDKRTGEVRAQAKYADQLEIYCVAVMSAFTAAKEIDAYLAFTDTGPRFPAIIRRTKDREPLPPVKRKDVAKLQAKWERRVEPMLNDTHFAPRPGGACLFCPFKKERGGPCAF